MIHTLFDPCRLDGAPNFRDLGGLPTADGRHIKPHRLLRSGHLAYISQASQQKLVEEYGLKTVIDLRTEMEMVQRPNVVLPGVEYIHCPIFEQKAEGVTRETSTPSDPVSSALRMAHHMDGRAHEQLLGLYSAFLSEEGAEHYRQFFDTLLRQEDGAVLWHCTMGKDRCGTGAFLLETALGVPRELAMADYLYTNDRLVPVTEDTISKAVLIEPDPALMDQIRMMDSVRPEFMGVVIQAAEDACGSLEAFLEERLGLTKDKRAKLQDMFLE